MPSFRAVSFVFLALLALACRHPATPGASARPPERVSVPTPPPEPEGAVVEGFTPSAVAFSPPFDTPDHWRRWQWRNSAVPGLREDVRMPEYGNASLGLSALLDAHLFIGTPHRSPPGGTLVAAESASGAERWRVPLSRGEVMTAGVVHGDALIVATADSVSHHNVTVQRLDRQRGTVLWRTAIAPCTRGRELVADDHRAYLRCDTGEVVALDLDAGLVRWHTAAGASAFALGGDVLVARMGEQLITLDTTTGTTHTTLPITVGSGHGSITIADGAVFAIETPSPQQGRLVAIDLAHPRRRWSTDATLSPHSVVVTVGDTVFTTTLGGALRATDLHTGATRWSLGLGIDHGDSSLWVDGGQLVALVHWPDSFTEGHVFPEARVAVEGRVRLEGRIWRGDSIGVRVGDTDLRVARDGSYRTTLTTRGMFRVEVTTVPESVFGQCVDCYFSHDGEPVWVTLDGRAQHRVDRQITLDRGGD